MTNDPWLSILLPSINKVKRGNFIESLRANATHFDEIEIIIDEEPGIVSGIERALYKARGDWVWFAADDLMCESLGWDAEFKKVTKLFADQIVMAFPNDCLFEETFACFPLLRAGICKLLTPFPYQRYKVDDSVMDIFPEDRKIYLSNVIMRHNVHESKTGFLTKSGKIYPIDNPDIGRIDHQRFLMQKRHRKMIREMLCQEMAQSLLG